MKNVELTNDKLLSKFHLSLLAILITGLLVVGLASAVYAQSVEDKDITSHIEAEFWADDAVPSNAIDIKTENGVVTLSGTVDNILAKGRAQKIAEATVGVRAVVNQLDVIIPFTINDVEIKNAVNDALLNDPAAESYEVQVQVQDGVVTLSGKVDSWQEKQLCATVAKGVKGVVDVKNNINVNYKADRTDYEIQQEVEKRLANDVRVDDAMIDVDVEDEKVILKGTVGSLQEKRQAYIDAWVGGVDYVNTEGLEIDWWARDEMRRKNLYVSRNDEEIKEAVKDAFLYDPRLLSFKIDVDVDYGTVTLSGVVDNLQAKKAAEKDAKNTIGVKAVVNNIKVRPVEIPSNKDLKKRVTRAFINDPYIERFKLDVSAYQGAVYLSGNVNTSWEKKRAEEIAEDVMGVVYVVNNIDYEHTWAWKPDWKIKEDVKDQLYWSPFVDKDEVVVSVNNGVVTLAGTVNTYSERQNAQHNAYEGGAKDVKNDLTVTYRTFGPDYYGQYGFYDYL